MAYGATTTPLDRFETVLVNTVPQGMVLLDEIDRPNVGFLLDTFDMNIEEKDIPAGVRAAKGRIVEFHACSSDRGTPGEDHLPWPAIVDALTDVGLDGPIVIEAFTPAIKEIARAVALWRPLPRAKMRWRRTACGFCAVFSRGSPDARVPYGAGAPQTVLHCQPGA